MRWEHATAKPILQPDTGLAQGTAFHDGYQVDHVAANAAVAGGDTRCGVAGPHLPRKIHGKALVTLARGMGGERTWAAQSVRSHRPQFHAIARQHAIDGDALFDTPEVGWWQWHELQRQTIPAVGLDDGALPAGLGNGQLRGAL